MGGHTVIALVLLAAGAAVLACYAVVRVAEALRESRGRLITDAADFNARMAAQNRPHTWVVPPASRTERAVYAAANWLSIRRRRRNRHAAAVRAAMGGEL
jgi:hypothetical protein